ncbi:hypothetical protein V8E53_010155 [Lactarius tabidus]|jgi:hypothetical protein
MRASFIATLVVVATAFAPAICAPLDSSLAARDSSPEVKIGGHLLKVRARDSGPKREQDFKNEQHYDD